MNCVLFNVRFRHILTNSGPPVRTQARKAHPGEVVSLLNAIRTRGARGLLLLSYFAID